MVVWYLMRPKPSDETARTTFIHRGIAAAVAAKRRPMARQENE